VLLAVVAIWTKQVESVLNLAFSLRGLTSGALLGGLLLAVFWRRGSAASVVTAMAASLLAMIGISTFFKDAVFWPWYTLIGTTITLIAAFTGQALSRAQKSGP
jgi:Na+/proline symporter